MFDIKSHTPLVEGSIKIPFTPFSSISGIPPTFVETIGKDALMASRIAIGKPSSRLGNIKISLCKRYSVTLFEFPINEIYFSILYFFTNISSSFLIAPSPIIVKWISGNEPVVFKIFKVSTINLCPFLSFTVPIHEISIFLLSEAKFLFEQHGSRW